MTEVAFTVMLLGFVKIWLLRVSVCVFAGPSTASSTMLWSFSWRWIRSSLTIAHSSSGLRKTSRHHRLFFHSIHLCEKKKRCLSDLIAISLKHCCRSGVGFHINQRKRADLMTQSLFFVFFNPRNREKAKSKEREEAWVKIENLAKSNPQVSACNHLTNPWFSFTTNVCWVRVYRTNIYEISVLCFVEL